MRNPGNNANDTNSHSSDARSDRQPGVTIVRLPFRRPTAVERRVLSRQSAAQRALRLVAGLALLVGSGTGVLMLPFSVRTRPLTADEALFTAVSALSTSGLNVITPGVDLSLFGQIVLMVLMQVGGIGFMVGAVLVYQLLG
ncbi:MAG TPA: potassium transporter TrkG, partial [Roseiflexaceae bacterium]|nr:potassium transporter TrkG [Roseiflexaceae bacterium]